MHRRASICWWRLACVVPALWLALTPRTPGAFTGPQARGPILAADPHLEARTVVRTSTIPNAGLGLFARVRIAAGEVIGELGGQLVDGPDMAEPSAYMVGLADCAFMQIPPFMYLDSKDHGGNISRANFAPSRINGRPTQFQNARLERLCRPPYVVAVALADIEPGTEIWLSYGPSYGYALFMDRPEIRSFFCGRLGLDCRERFEFEP